MLDGVDAVRAVAVRRLKFAGRGRILKRASLFRSIAVNAPAIPNPGGKQAGIPEMAEEMSGRKPTFCCSEEGSRRARK